MVQYSPSIERKKKWTGWNPMSFRKEGEIKTFSDKGKLRVCWQQTYLRRMAKGSFLNRKEIKEEIL